MKKVPYNVQQIGVNTVVEFQTASLMDLVELEVIGRELYKLVDEQDHRRLVLDFERVQYISSQAIGIVLNLQKRLTSLKGGRLILCGLGSRLMELIKITGLDRILVIKSSQQEALSEASRVKT